MIQYIYKPHFLFIGIPIHDTLALQCKGVLRSDSTSLVNVAIFGIRYLGRKFIAFDDSYSVVTQEVLVVTRTVFGTHCQRVSVLGQVTGCCKGSFIN